MSRPTPSSYHDQLYLSGLSLPPWCRTAWKENTRSFAAVSDWNIALHSTRMALSLARHKHTQASALYSATMTNFAVQDNNTVLILPVMLMD